MADPLRLENGENPKGSRNEQVARSEAECQTSNEGSNVCPYNSKLPRVPRNGVVFPPAQKEKQILNVTKFTCKKCNCLVWINNDTKESIRNEFTGEYYNKECGLCRSCFVNLRNREMIINRGHISE